MASQRVIFDLRHEILQIIWDYFVVLVKRKFEKWPKEDQVMQKRSSYMKVLFKVAGRIIVKILGFKDIYLLKFAFIIFKFYNLSQVHIHV